VWDQSGLEELVTITAPKKIEKHLTDGLDQQEVHSRLKALASTIDSRGWAIKHAAADPLGNPYTLPAPGQTSDRLINISAMPQPVPETDLRQLSDPLDENNVVSSGFDQMIQNEAQERLRQNLEKMDRVRHGEPLETAQQPEVYFNPPPQENSFENPAAAQEDVADEQALSRQLREERQGRDLANGNMQKLQPQASTTQPVQASSTAGGDQDDLPEEELQARAEAMVAASIAGLAPVSPSPGADGPEAATTLPDGQETEEQTGQDTKAQAVSTTPVDPAILSLSHDNNRDVASLGREANRITQETEVVVLLR
jgi:hypothetical protein